MPKSRKSTSSASSKKASSVESQPPSAASDTTLTHPMDTTSTPTTTTQHDQTVPVKRKKAALPPPMDTNKKSRKEVPPSLLQAIPTFETMDDSDMTALKPTPMAHQRRRSSFSLRGKRKSSMAELQAAVHGDIAPENFFKHVSPELPDPVRLRQIIIFALQRVMDDITADASDEDKGAKIILQNIFQDMITKKMNTSWYHRERDEVPVVVKPNPRNEQNARFLAGYDQEIERLEKEIQEWQVLLDHAPDVELPLGRPLSSMSTGCFTETEQGLLALEQGGHDAERQAEWAQMTSQADRILRDTQNIGNQLQSVKQVAQVHQAHYEKQFKKLIDACWPLDEEALLDEEAVEATKLRLTAMSKAFYAEWNQDKTQDLLRVLSTAMSRSD